MKTFRFPSGALATGFGGLLLGLLVIVIGYAVIGSFDSKTADVAAGTTVVIGMTMALLSVFLFLLPPLLPSK